MVCTFSGAIGVTANETNITKLTAIAVVHNDDIAAASAFRRYAFVQHVNLPLCQLMNIGELFADFLHLFFTVLEQYLNGKCGDEGSQK